MKRDQPGLRGRRIERVGLGFEAGRHLGVGVGRAGHGGSEAQMLGSSPWLAARAKQLAQAHVSVGEVRELVKEPGARTRRSARNGKRTSSKRCFARLDEELYLAMTSAEHRPARPKLPAAPSPRTRSSR